MEFYNVLGSNFVPDEIRPTKGMSVVTDALAKSTETLGAKITTGNKIVSIRKPFKKFILKTSEDKMITATKLVIAVPPAGPV